MRRHPQHHDQSETSRPHGFTLVELLIVVAIIGILASIAIPNFMRFTGRSKRAEAKVMLRAIATVEKATYHDLDSFTDNFRKLEWSPDGAPRYVYGFVSDATPSASGCNDTAECGGGFQHHRMVDAFGVPLTSADLPPEAVVSREAFTIGAVGNVDNDGDLDVWTLNDANQLINLEDDLD